MNVSFIEMYGNRINNMQPILLLFLFYCVISVYYHFKPSKNNNLRYKYIFSCFCVSFVAVVIMIKTFFDWFSLTS